MNTPKKVKFRKFQQKVQINTYAASAGFNLSLGIFGIIATTPGQLTSRQQDAGRRVLAR